MALEIEDVKLVSPEQEPLRVGFVGPSSPKWTYDGLKKAEQQMIGILKGYMSVFPRRKIIVVSGGCPVGNKRYYCAHCGSFLEGRTIGVHLGSLEPEYETIEIYDEGGVDMLAEIVAFKLGLETDIKRPDMQSDGKFHWEDEKQLIPQSAKDVYPKGAHALILEGYRSRNIQIAKVCDVLYCIVPKVKLPVGFDITMPETLSKEFACFHCHKVGHPHNGGCWTKKYTEGIGKETHLIVIE